MCNSEKSIRFYVDKKTYRIWNNFYVKGTRLNLSFYDTLFWETSNGIFRQCSQWFF